MFETPYQTTPCSRFNLERTVSGIRRLEIDGALITNTQTPPGIKLVPPGVVEFQPFHQPMTRREINTLEAEIVVDGRSLLKADHTPSKLDVFAHAMLYAELTRLWAYGHISKRDLLDVGDFPAKVFSSWITSQLTLRLQLDLGQSLLARACCILYYIQLHDPLPENNTPADIDRLLVRAARVLGGMDAATLGGHLGEIRPMHSIQDLVDTIIRTVNSPRTEKLTVAFIYIALGFSWGPAYRETVAVALEYPPAFISLMYSSVHERSYTKTGLGKVIERLVSRNNDKEFLKNVNHLIGKR